MHRLRTAQLFACMIALLAVLVPAATVVAHEAVDQPFDALRLAPPNVSLYLRVSDAAKLRRELAARPIADWFSALLNDSDVANAFGELARATGAEQGALFDTLFGRDVVLLSRAAGDGAAARDEWAVLTRIDRASHVKVMQRLAPQVLSARHGIATFGVPEQDVILAWSDNWLLLAPRSQPALLDDVLRRFAKGDQTIAEPMKLPLEKALTLGSGDAALFVRHADDVLGGWSVMSASLEDNRIRLHHAGQFDSPPLSRPISRLTIDAGVLGNLRKGALIAVLEPTDIGDSTLELFVQQTVGDGLLSKEMREARGDRRIIMVGEREGRLDEPAVNVLAPEAAICFEVRQNAVSRTMVDQHMTQLATDINNLVKGSYLIQVPDVRAYRLGHPRSIDLSPLKQSLAGEGGFPVMPTLSLNWRLVDATDTSWCVISTSSAQLAEIERALVKKAEAVNVQCDSAGTLNGIRVATHLQSWGEQAAALAQPGREDELRRGLRMLSTLAAGIEHAGWTLQRPSRNEIELEIELELAPPRSEGE